MIKRLEVFSEMGKHRAGCLGLDSQDRPGGIVACLGERKLVPGKSKTLRGLGTGGMRAFGFQNQVARFFEVGSRYQPGVLGPSPLVTVADRFSTLNLWFYDLAGTLRIEPLA